jgi:hypothetical protein
MPNLREKASEIDDPAVMLERIRYRNQRIITHIHRHADDPATYAKRLAGYTRSDIKRLADLLGIELNEG